MPQVLGTFAGRQVFLSTMVTPLRHKRAVIMGSSTRYLHRLRPPVRQAILDYLADHPHDRPVYVASVIHYLSERGLTVSRSELVVKNAIAEAAILRGLTVGFGRPPLGLGLNFYHPIRRALVQLRRIQR